MNGRDSDGTGRRATRKLLGLRSCWGLLAVEVHCVASRPHEFCGDLEV